MKWPEFTKRSLFCFAVWHARTKCSSCCPSSSLQFFPWCAQIYWNPGICNYIFKTNSKQYCAIWFLLMAQLYLLIYFWLRYIYPAERFFASSRLSYIPCNLQKNDCAWIVIYNRHSFIKAHISTLLWLWLHELVCFVCFNGAFLKHFM